MHLRFVDPKKDVRFTLVSMALLTYVVTILILSVGIARLNSDLKKVNKDFANIKTSQENFDANFAEELFNEHLALSEKQKIEFKLKTLELEIEKLRQTDDGQLFLKVDKIYTLFSDFGKKVKRNDSVKIESAKVDEKVTTWGALLINQDFEKLTSEMETTNTELDTKYTEYLKTLPPPPSAAGNGYSYVTVNANNRSFGVYLIKLPLASYKVKTVSVSDGDCEDNCATKSLATFVADNSAVAGMNGSYFCPPDYANCSGKVNSFDYALYSSNKGKWINKDARTWGDTGMMTFNGNSVKYYEKSSSYDGDSVTGAISNYPSLVDNSEVDIKESTLTSYQKDVRGLRGAIGVGGENIFLALISNATVIDAAHVMKALGVKSALNLDGGGSSAMYINGGYIIGPGRSLPNAIVIVKN